MPTTRIRAAVRCPAHYGLAHPRILTSGSPVATQIPHATGAALASKIRGDGGVSIVYFGDGASSKGDFHEGFNFAAIHRLPAIFVCENNQYAISVPTSKQMAVRSVADRAVGYAMVGESVDGSDPLAVYRCRARRRRSAPAAATDRRSSKPTCRASRRTRRTTTIAAIDPRASARKRAAAIRSTSSRTYLFSHNLLSEPKLASMRARIETPWLRPTRRPRLRLSLSPKPPSITSTPDVRVPDPRFTACQSSE